MFNYQGCTTAMADLAGFSIRGEILVTLRRRIDICEAAELAKDQFAFIRSVPVALKNAAKVDAAGPGFYNGL
jgi:hypothetical protein